MFDNKNRNRYYGHRVGDLVKWGLSKNEYSDPYIYKVVGLGFMDNNCIYAKKIGRGNFKVQSLVAEWYKTYQAIDRTNEGQK